MKKKTKPIVQKRLKRKYKVILFILVISLFATGLNFILQHLPEHEEESFGQIQATEITEVPEEEEDLGGFSDDIDEEYEENNFMFKVLDVGQGLSILLKNEDKTMLIDTGYYEYADKVQQELEKTIENNTLNFAVSTHSDSDHCGSFANVVRNFDVERVIYGDDTSKETSWMKFKEAVKEKDVPFENDSDISLDMGKDCTVTIYDIVDDAEDVNDNSICLVVNFKGKKFLVTGDLTKKYEKKLLSSIPNTIDVVVAGHHGSKTSNSFLSALNGISYFVVSAGLENDYHMPHEAVLDAANRYSTYTVGTFRDGDIIFTVENNDLYCSAETELTAEQDTGAPVLSENQDEE